MQIFKNKKKNFYLVYLTEKDKEEDQKDSRV